MKNVLKKACCALLALLFVFGMIASAGPAYAEGPSEPAAPAEDAPETVTVKFDLGAGHEAWAQSELLREKLESYGRGLTVVGVEGSVMSIEAPPSYPEPDGTRIKNSVNGLSSAFDIVLSRTITGEDGKYDFPDAFDAGEWLYSVGLKPMEAYGSYADYRAETEENDKVMPVEGQTFYALWAKPVEEASITIEAPVCGTEITVEYIQSENPDVGYPLTVQEPHPNAVVSAQNAALDVEEGIPACLWKQEDAENPDIPFFWEAYSGPVTGGETYLAEVDLRADFGYYFPEDVKINVTGGTLDSDLSYILYDIYLRSRRARLGRLDRNQGSDADGGGGGNPHLQSRSVPHRDARDPEAGAAHHLSQHKGRRRGLDEGQQRDRGLHVQSLRGRWRDACALHGNSGGRQGDRRVELRCGFRRRDREAEARLPEHLVRRTAHAHSAV